MNTGAINSIMDQLNSVEKSRNAFVGKDKEVNKVSETNENKLSKKAQDYLKNLRSQYKDYDFFVGNTADDLKSLSKSGKKEFSIILSNDEIEKMASDEKYAKEKLDAMDGAIKMSRKISEENGFNAASKAADGKDFTVEKLTVEIDDKGNSKFFAELKKTNSKVKELQERIYEKRAEEKKAADRKASEKKDEPESTKLEADTLEDLIEKIKNFSWNE